MKAETKELSKKIRKDLKNKFPTTKFKVRIYHFTNIRITWTAGVALSEVKEFVGKTWDYQENYHINYITFDRTNTKELLEKANQIFCERYGIEPYKVEMKGNIFQLEQRARTEALYNGRFLNELEIYRLMESTSL